MSGLVVVKKIQILRERSGPTLRGCLPPGAFTGRSARRLRRSCSVLQSSRACCKRRGEGKAVTTASATAGLTRLNCLICRHHTPLSPEPSLVTCWPEAQCPVRGELGEGLGEGTHILTQLSPRGYQQHIQVCMELKQHQSLGSVKVGMDLVLWGIPIQ